MVIDLEECRVEQGQILADGVRQWRPDCKAGQFKIGSSTMRGPRLDMEIVAAQSHYGQLFNYPPMDWLGLLFVDPDGALSAILLKTESRDNFLELRRQMKIAGQSMLGNVLRAGMTKRTGKDGGSYYAVEWERLDQSPKYALAIADFRQQQTDYNALIQFRETADIESKSQILAAVRAAA